MSTNSKSTGSRNRKTNAGRGKTKSKPAGGRGPSKRHQNSPRPGPPNSNKPAATKKTAQPQPRKQLKNGEKGADSHTVAEQGRIQFTSLLLDFRERDDQERLEMPATLTNTERKFIHELAAQLGLKSKSTGKDENRRIVVTKRAHVVKQTEEEDVPVLRVGRKGTEALRKHLQRFPPTRTEELESHKTGASLVEALQGSNGAEGDSTAAVEQTLTQMGLVLHPEHETGAISTPEKVANVNRRKRQHANAQKRKLADSNYRTMQTVRSKLPAFAHQEEIVKTIADNRVTIVSGETGSGKTTQVPQFVLDANPTASVVVTQPRRISAISVAERVAQEQCLEPVGGMIGYQVRMESAVSRDTQLLFLTPGVLLRKLQSSRHLHEYSHIVIDEIHERDKYTDFLLVALRDLLPQRPDLRIILMSATLQIDLLVDYWRGFPGTPAQVHLQGRTFPVQDFFLEQVLAMTGYLDGMNQEVSTDQLEAELAALTSRNTGNAALTCVMCGKGGFLDAHELGEHIALCDGGRNETMDALDARVRHTDGAAVGVDSLAPSFIQNGYLDELDDGSKWDGVSPFQAPDVSVSGPSPPQEQLLEQYQSMHDDEQVDFDLLLHVVQFIVKSSFGDGAILVFFPGWQEISEFSLLLENSSPFHDRSKYSILPLHSGIPSREQRRVFQKPPPGVRSIILSTNIAETSVTIDGVAFVVDTGRAKEKSYDPHLKTGTLQPVWISQASAKQRKGRAGRTKAGVRYVKRAS